MAEKYRLVEGSWDDDWNPFQFYKVQRKDGLFRRWKDVSIDTNILCHGLPALKGASFEEDEFLKHEAYALKFLLELRKGELPSYEEIEDLGQKIKGVIGGEDIGDVDNRPLGYHGRERTPGQKARMRRC